MPPETYFHTITVTPDDIDQLGHVNNVTFVRWLQDVAIAAWDAHASPEDHAKFLWVVMRHEIDYKRPGRLGDTLIARTWVGPATRLAFERNIEFTRASDGVVLVRARTLWCPVHIDTMKPAAVPPSVRERFSVPASSGKSDTVPAPSGSR